MKKTANGIQAALEQGELQISVLSERIIRVRKIFAEDPLQQELVLTQPMPTFSAWDASETAEEIEVQTPAVRAVFDKKTENIRYYSREDGACFLQEQGAFFEPAVTEPSLIGSAEQCFAGPEEEVIGGLGQQADGAEDYKGRFVHLNQFNTINAVPVLVSTAGYGILWNNSSLTEVNRQKTRLPLDLNLPSKTSSGNFTPEETGEYVFIMEKTNKNTGYEDVTLAVGDTTIIRRGTSWHPNYYTGKIFLEAGKSYPVFLNACANVYYQLPSQRKQTTIWSESAPQIDYCLMYGPEADQIVASYRSLTGDAPLFPKWAYGYWQSKECYKTGEEVLDVVAEYRRRNHPLDAIVQDWRYWGDYGWNAMVFAEDYTEDAGKLIGQIHDQDVHFMLSVWPNFGDTEKNEAFREFSTKGYLMDDNVLEGLGEYTAALQGLRRNYYDVWNPEARNAFWKRMNSGLFSKGVDAWWMDATEPNLWSLQGAYHLYQTSRGPAARWVNAYSLIHAKGVYEHQRAEDESKRVFMLSRTGFTGIQKYAAAVWSGDTWQSWELLRRQITDGLHYGLSGLPYWTTDIGGFSGGRCEDPDYRELYLRWFQFGTFCPIFRAHGTGCPREVWQFGEEAEKILHEYLLLRYRLMPYIYSLAWQVTHYHAPMMRSLWMDFRQDHRTWKITDQYLFGPSLMVCPVTEKGAVSREVYLPEGSVWYDYRTGRCYEGGQTICADAPIDVIPLFVRGGSMLLQTEPAMHTCQEKLVEIRVYAGKDAEFAWYRDGGDSYDYEKGVYAEARICWNEREGKLTIQQQEGSYSVEDQLVRVTVLHPDGSWQSSDAFAWDGTTSVTLSFEA